MKKKVLSLLLVLVLLVTALAVMTQAEETLPAGGAIMVKHDGEEVVQADPAVAWATGEYAYVKLYGATDAFANMQGELWVDLNGNDLTVGGEGKLYAFDSANDTYDAEACGTVTNTGEVDIQKGATNPITKFNYVTVADGTTATFHRINVSLTHVTLQTARTGIYYKALYHCDATLEELVDAYGVVLSVNNMPGADFKEEIANGDKDRNRYTIASEPFRSGVVANSGALVEIMKEDQSVRLNNQHSNIKVYANAYIELDGYIVVGDNENAGNTATQENFNGAAYSLQSVMTAVDDYLYTYTKADRETISTFYNTWKDRGLGAGFAQIDALDEKPTADMNANLAFASGTTNAYCPVCKKTVTWTKVTTSTGKLGEGHYYLEESLSKSGQFLIIPNSGQTACLHLNGNNLTSTDNVAITGAGGVLNVMGKGNVTGTSGSAYAGCAVFINNAAGGRINLYGGTYCKSGIKSNNGVIAIKKGTIYMGPGADIKNTSYGEVYMGDASGADSVLILDGIDLSDCQMRFRGNNGSGYNVILQVIDSKVQSVLNLPHTDDLVIKGESVIGSVTLTDGAKITAEQMAPGSSVKVVADGIFTKPAAFADTNKNYFVSDSIYKNITVRDGALFCGKDYTSSAPITGSYCPVCEETVTWTQLTADNAGVLNGHYYLANDLNYTGTAVPLNAPGSGKTACVHLNGHKLTSASTTAIHGSSGVINVMGTGTVTGYSSSQGAAVQTNNGASTINLYAGTYQQTEISTNAYTIYTRGHGGTINVYEDAKVLGNTSGNAIYTSTCDDQDARLNLYSAYVQGDIVMPGIKDAPNCDNFVTIDSAKIDGNVYVNGLNKITLIGTPVIKYMELSEQSRLTLERLAQGAQINVLANGEFAVADSDDNASAYGAYFTHPNKAAEVVAEGQTMTYKVNYEKNLSFAEGTTTAYCPVCQENKQWTKLVAGDATFSLVSGNHYYLETSQTFEVAATFVSAPSSGTVCLHLNGQNLTATKSNAIFGSGSTLNVMGSGEIAGFTGTANQGAAVYTNNANGTINLYSGTYKKYTGVGSNSAVIGTGSRGHINVYADATIQNSSGQSVFVGGTAGNKSAIRLYGATVTGGTVEMKAATPGEGNYRIFYAEDATINAAVTVTADTEVTITGKTVIDQLTVPAGTLIDVSGMEKGSSVKISADGAFTAAFTGAEDFDRYFTTGDEGKWVYSRNGILYETANAVADATADDIAALDADYTGMSVAYGEMHDHTASGGKSDGKQTLTTWVEEMNKIGMDFATIVDHRQSRHMYLPEWDKDRFIGGTEPAATITEMKAETNTPHYNMIFTDPAGLEKTLQDMNFRSITADANGYGLYYEYTDFTFTDFQKLAQTVRDNGGIFTLVHPRYDGYINSEDPNEYFLSDYSYFEITTGTGGNMCYEFNEKAYQTWLDLLALDKKVWASAGSDFHNLPNTSALTTLYARAKQDGEYMNAVYFENMRVGNLTAGSVGIRMSIGDAVMGSEGAFAGNRVLFSVGDMHSSAYDASHTYRVELYDDKGRVFETTFDASQTNYFAYDADASSKFYRVVVWDDTLNTRIAVGNPIWNTAVTTE